MGRDIRKAEEKKILNLALIGSMISLISKSMGSGKMNYDSEKGWTDDEITESNLGFSVIKVSEEMGTRVIINIFNEYYVGYLNKEGVVRIKDERYGEFVSSVYRYFDKENHFLSIGLNELRDSNYVSSDYSKKFKDNMTIALVGGRKDV